MNNNEKSASKKELLILINHSFCEGLILKHIFYGIDMVSLDFDLSSILGSMFCYNYALGFKRLLLAEFKSKHLKSAKFYAHETSFDEISVFSSDLMWFLSIYLGSITKLKLFTNTNILEDILASYKVD